MLKNLSFVVCQLSLVTAHCLLIADYGCSACGAGGGAPIKGGIEERPKMD